MINKVLAEKFIENIKKYTNYAFIIINEDGIIIAATEKDRVGIFHEASYLMMQQKREIAIVEPQETSKYLGVKPGVDMPILYNDKVVGAIGITGIPKDVKPIVLIAKMSIETMLEYEIYKDMIAMKKNDADNFHSMLLNCEKKDIEELTAKAKEFNYNTDIVRICVLIKLTKPEKSLDLYNACLQNKLFSPQDITFVDQENRIIVFKSVNNISSETYKNYKLIIEELITNVEVLAEQFMVNIQYYIGSPQNKLEYYKISYNHCLWMMEYKHPNQFFYNYIDEYLKNTIPLTTFHEIYNVFKSTLSKSETKEMIELFKSLKKNNYNITKTSKNLYMHKNTLIFKINKIRRSLSINPIHNAFDKDFMENLCYYLDILNKKKPI